MLPCFVCRPRGGGKEREDCDRMLFYWFSRLVGARECGLWVFGFVMVCNLVAAFVVRERGVLLVLVVFSSSGVWDPMPHFSCSVVSAYTSICPFTSAGHSIYMRVTCILWETGRRCWCVFFRFFWFRKGRRMAFKSIYVLADQGFSCGTRSFMCAGGGVYVTHLQNTAVQTFYRAPVG